ncbi:MAG: peptidoglycan binding protein CsiV [Gammaproteobacteria bacterium]|nr:peptidoglycan binding protein CsiV [Gammaproteobacteria bacterium]
MRFWHGIITLVIGTLVISSPSTLAAETDERWFDIEVIVFKNKRSSLDEEIWPEKSPILFPENIEDFITDNAFPAPEGLISSTEQQRRLSNAKSKKNTGEDKDSFVLMPSEQFQLNGIFGSLTRSSWYEPLAHFAWRQSVKDKTAAEWVRVVGGKNYVDEFNFNGHEKEDSQAVAIKPTTLINETNPNEGLIYQPVPEVDGSLQVYLNRYLHISTDLFIRIPGEEELDITAISNSLSSSMLELTNDGVMNQEYESSFDWSFQSDNWLDPQKQTTRVKRLLNYPLTQSRRIRSGEVHYFDHPLYGVIIQVRPYDPNANPKNNGTSAGR